MTEGAALSWVTAEVLERLSLVAPEGGLCLVALAVAGGRAAAPYLATMEACPYLATQAVAPYLAVVVVAGLCRKDPVERWSCLGAGEVEFYSAILEAALEEPYWTDISSCLVRLSLEGEGGLYLVGTVPNL